MLVRRGDRSRSGGQVALFCGVSEQDIGLRHRPIVRQRQQNEHDGNDSAPVGLDVSANGSFVYVIDSSDKISSYAVDQTTGALTQVGSSVTTGNGASDVSADMAGHFVFVTNQGDNTISIYQVDQSTGASVNRHGNSNGGRTRIHNDRPVRPVPLHGEQHGEHDLRLLP